MRKRFISLLMKSARVQSAIEAEQKRPLPDWARLFRLKRLRVAIKDKVMGFLRPIETREPVRVSIRGRHS